MKEMAFEWLPRCSFSGAETKRQAAVLEQAEFEGEWQSRRRAFSGHWVRLANKYGPMVFWFDSRFVAK